MDNEKRHDNPQAATIKSDPIDTTAIEKDNISHDGDDALKLAGSHACGEFDEKYYSRLRRKIASTFGGPELL